MADNLPMEKKKLKNLLMCFSFLSGIFQKSSVSTSSDFSMLFIHKVYILCLNSCIEQRLKKENGKLDQICGSLCQLLKGLLQVVVCIFDDQLVQGVSCF